ncbi:beta-1,3-galactosyltransferase brn [Halyomorpha halys]|uniref:beta-1,3-galactosyltransferase brn n=1 Tax=Halyomorpha halys TaxID=286706 RepID=UPI0006D52188|nr:beta-1,3-galactosyltransferase brn [Halyomorpha halys]
MFHVSRRTSKILKILVVLSVVFYFFGVFSMMFEVRYEDIDQLFIPDLPKYIKQLQLNQTPDLPPINYYEYNFINIDSSKCDLVDGEYSLTLVYIIKSAPDNFKRREAIRKSWGFEKRFSDVPIRRVFMLGLPSSNDVQYKIDQESIENKDIVQANFVDAYYNNTIKTMMGMKWAVTKCNRSKFYFFSDDDMYVSTKNVLRFVRNPLEYPYYLEVPFTSYDNQNKQNENSKQVGQIYDIELPGNAELYAGYMFFNSRPLRQLYSKWYISIAEYPFSRYPPYITAGAFVLSKEALHKLYYASFYIKHFRFDDIYLALLAKGSNVIPVHCNEFYFYKKHYSDYKYVIASHGYDDPEELQKVWNNEKFRGNA